jgi:sec-independent protein translocase protein TatB
MFGMGGSEIIVILIVALLFLGPDKLPGAAKTISKGIRDIKKQSRALQNQIESDETIGGAIKDLKSALRGDEIPVRRPPVPKKAIEPPIDQANTIAKPEDVKPDDAEPVAQAALEEANAKPFSFLDVEDAPAKQPEPVKITLPNTAGQTDGPAPSDEETAELAALVKPAPGTVAKGS